MPAPRVQAADQRARCGEQVGLAAVGHDHAAADDHQVVGDDLDLVQQVRGQQDGAAALGEALEQPAHPVDAGRVESVGGLVQDQHLRVTEQCVRDAEPLPHAEGVVADPAVALAAGQADDLEHLVDPATGQPHHGGAEAKDLAAGPAGVLRRGVQQDADVPAGVGELGVRDAQDGAATRGWRGQPGHHAHRGRLACPVGTEEAGDGPGLGSEGHAVDGKVCAVALAEFFDSDHGSSLSCGAGPHIGAGLPRGATGYVSDSPW